MSSHSNSQVTNALLLAQAEQGNMGIKEIQTPTEACPLIRATDRSLSAVETVRLDTGGLGVLEGRKGNF